MEYTTLNSYLKDRFGQKVYKIALNGGFSCPNRDGTIGQENAYFALREAAEILPKALPCQLQNKSKKAKAGYLEKSKTENTLHIFRHLLIHMLLLKS